MNVLYVAYGIGSWILLPTVALFAWTVGGRPERAAATMYLGAMAASAVGRSDNAYLHPELAVCVVDVLLLIGLIWLSLAADRFWPLPSAAFQALSCIAHFQKAIEPGSYTVGYQLLAEVSTYPTLLLLAAGTVRAHARRPKHITIP